MSICIFWDRGEWPLSIFFNSKEQVFDYTGKYLPWEVGVDGKLSVATGILAMAALTFKGLAFWLFPET